MFLDLQIFPFSFYLFFSIIYYPVGSPVLISTKVYTSGFGNVCVVPDINPVLNKLVGIGFPKNNMSLSATTVVLPLTITSKVSPATMFTTVPFSVVLQVAALQYTALYTKPLKFT